MTVTQISAVLKRGGRRDDSPGWARDIQAVLRTPHLSQPGVVAEAYAGGRGRWRRGYQRAQRADQGH